MKSEKAWTIAPHTPSVSIATKDRWHDGHGGLVARTRMMSPSISMQASLRLATKSDASDIATVLIESRLAFLPFAPSPHPPEDVRRWVAEHLIPSCVVHLAEMAGRVVAVMALSRDDAFCWIEQLYVLPGHTGTGLGSRLLAQARLGCPIRLYTFQANSGARRFYERHGYVAIEFSDGLANEEKCPDVLYELCAAGR